MRKDEDEHEEEDDARLGFLTKGKDTKGEKRKSEV